MADQRDGGISWTDETWNPVRGCSRVSEGCRNCYAERVAARFSGPGQPYEGLARNTAQGPRWTGEVRLVEEHLADPLRWKRPRRVFVNSMSDLFHESLPESAILAVFSTMAKAPQHTFQILTKRPARMLEILARWKADGLTLREGCGAELPNVWLGVSVEDQATADERIPLLLQTPAAIRFISAEPLLGAVDLTRTLWPGKEGWPVDVLRGGTWTDSRGFINISDLPGQPNLISWVIAGGESGPGARPCHPDWARSLRDQCRAAGVAYFFKQWGEWRPLEGSGAGSPTPIGYWDHDGSWRLGLATFRQNMVRVGKKTAGNLLDGREWREFPEAQLPEEARP